MKNVFLYFIYILYTYITSNLADILSSDFILIVLNYPVIKRFCIRN